MFFKYFGVLKFTFYFSFLLVFALLFFGFNGKTFVNDSNVSYSLYYDISCFLSGILNLMPFESSEDLPVVEIYDDYVYDLSTERISEISEDSYEDADLLKYYILRKKSDVIKANFPEISSGEYYDKIILHGYSLKKDSKNTYFLADNKHVLYDQTFVRISERKVLNERDLEVIKNKIDGINGDFNFEYSKLISRARRSNGIAAEKIIDYFFKSGLSDLMKDEIFLVFSSDVNLLVIDDLIDELIFSILNFGYQGGGEYIRYLNEQKSKVIKFDKTGSGALFDLVVTERNVYFDEVELIREFVIPSELYFLLNSSDNFDFSKISNDYLIKLNPFFYYNYFKSGRDGELKLYFNAAQIGMYVKTADFKFYAAACFFFFLFFILSFFMKIDLIFIFLLLPVFFLFFLSVFILSGVVIDFVLLFIFFIIAVMSGELIKIKGFVK